MACFLVPAAESVAASAVKKCVKNKAGEDVSKHPFLNRLGWLNNMLLGGSALLAFEHIWHGEVTPWFPFLTNAANPDDAVNMIHEMATNGVGMAILVTAVWIGMVMASKTIGNKPSAVVSALNGGKQE